VLQVLSVAVSDQCSYKYGKIIQDN